MQNPAFLSSFDDLDAHVNDFFRDLENVEKGTRFATFVSGLVSFLPQFREFGEARLSERHSYDGGVDVISDALENGKRLCIQARLHLTGKEDVDGIISKFQAFESSEGTKPHQGVLFDAGAPPTLTFGIVTISKTDGIIRRYRESSLSSRPYYDRLVSEGRLYVIDGLLILSVLQTAYGKTYGTASEVDISSVAGWIKHDGVQLGFVRASELVSLYTKNGDAIFFENIRDYLGPTSGRVDPGQRRQPTVNEEIADTIAREPRRFLEKNNGVTFKARKIKELGDGKLKLEDSSIVNGCQTTMSLVGAKANVEDCIVQVKIITSEDAWDVAKAANFQNVVDRIELDLARYLRPQVVRMAAIEAGVQVENDFPTSAVSLLGCLYTGKVQYDEVRHLYIGIMSRSPNNVRDNNYTELRADLIQGFAENADHQKLLLSTLFRIALATDEANQTWHELVAGEAYAKPFLRFFHPRKPQYRVFLAILSLCAVFRIDISEHLTEKAKEVLRVVDFLRRTNELLVNDPTTFIRTYARAITAVAAEARMTSDDDERLRQTLTALLARGFKSSYSRLTMEMDMEAKLKKL